MLVDREHWLKFACYFEQAVVWSEKAGDARCPIKKDAHCCKLGLSAPLRRKLHLKCLSLAAGNREDGKSLSSTAAKTRRTVQGSIRNLAHSCRVRARTATATRDLFLSHSSKDKSVVREIAGAIEAESYGGRQVRVWVDEAEIRSGESIPGKGGAAQNQIACSAQH
jgi:hypothetical protein